MENIKKEDGFTMVELMIVVAIIGALSVVAVPNFKKYQAKSKVSEGMMQLSAVFVVQQAFYGEFGLYHSCLNFMGFSPENDVASRYYAVGINQAAAINSNAYSTAVNSGLLPASCPDNQVPTSGETWFPAGKGAGGTFAAVMSPAAGSIGTQVSGDQTFTIYAEGVISVDKISLIDRSIIAMNEDKVFEIISSGY